MAKRREKGSGSLIKIAGCRFWYAQYYKDGRQIRVSTKTEVKQEALAALRRFMGDSERGLLPASELRKVHYGDLRKALLDNYVERGNKSLLTTADGEETINGLKHLDEFFGYRDGDPGWPVMRITTDSAREFARKRKAEGVGNATINRSLAALRRMLRLAQEDGKLQVAPKIRLLKEPPARRGFLKLDDFNRLLAALPEHLRPLVTFLYYCGVRLGEARQITWAQVDLNAALIRLEDDQTKTGEARTVPLPDMLIAMLRKLEPTGGPIFKGTNLRKAWQKACVVVGLGRFVEVPGKPHGPRYEGLIVHDLRRSAIRNLIDAGVSEKVAMTISGHKTREVFDRYHIVDPTDVLDAMRKVESKSLLPHRRISERLVKSLPAATGKRRVSA